MKLFPGVSFSWRRAVGLSRAKARLARAAGVPTTRRGLERRVGSWIIGLFRRKR